MRVELRILVIAGRVAVDDRGAGRDGRGVRESRGAGLGKAGGGIGVQGTVHRVCPGAVGETRPLRDAPEVRPMVCRILATDRGRTGHLQLPGRGLNIELGQVEDRVKLVGRDFGNQSVEPHQMADRKIGQTGIDGVVGKVDEVAEVDGVRGGRIQLRTGTRCRRADEEVPPSPEPPEALGKLGL